MTDYIPPVARTGGLKKVDRDSCFSRHIHTHGCVALRSTAARKARKAKDIYIRRYIVYLEVCGGLQGYLRRFRMLRCLVGCSSLERRQ